MRRISVFAWSLTLLSAGLQVFVFPIAGSVPRWRSSVSWFILVPFLLAVLAPARDGKPLAPREAAWLGYLCGFLWYSGSCAWIYQTMFLYGGLPKPIAFGILLLFSLYLGLYHALFAALLSMVRRSSLGVASALSLSPFLWVSVELARARITGFPWDLLGNTQVDNLLLTRIAPVAGVMSISFVLAAGNAAFAWFFLGSRKKLFLVPAAALIFAFTVQFPQSLPVLRKFIPPQDPVPAGHGAVLMQENLEVGAVGREVKPLSQAEELESFSSSSLHPRVAQQTESAGATWVSTDHIPAPTVIIWPEAPSHLRSEDPSFRDGMAHLAITAQAPLIIGSLGIDFIPSAPRGYLLYDSASLFTAAGTYAGRYDKVHLVPWGEYIPFKQFFGFAHKLTEGVGDMDPGHDRTVFTAAGHTYGVFVCYESIFGDEVRHFADQGAEVLVQISDDGWYGDTGAPWQHLNMARMRAIENHRWLLRATNTGITTAIDPQGRMAVQAPRHVRAAFVFPFGFEQSRTFYTRHGDWFAYLCAVVTLVAVGAAFLNHRRTSGYARRSL